MLAAYKTVNDVMIHIQPGSCIVGCSLFSLWKLLRTMCVTYVPYWSRKQGHSCIALGVETCRVLVVRNSDIHL